MHRFRKAGMSVAAVALASSGIVALFAMPASAKAAAGPKGKITCTTMSGSTTSGHIVISGCSGSAVPGTGGSSTSLSITLLAAGGNVTWVNGKVTHFSAPALASAKATHCPGYVKSSKKHPYSGQEPSLEKFSGTVTSDNTGLKVPGKYKGEVCISNNAAGSFSAAKPLKIS
jgi:hypothetical protein